MMLELLHKIRDNITGRGEAAITIPIFDGALKPNSLLDEAAIVGEFDAPEDIASDGEKVWVTDGKRILLRVDEEWRVVASFDRKITALACMPDGGFAVALDGVEVRIVDGRFDGKSWKEAGGIALCAVNGLAAVRGGAIAVSDGSTQYPYGQWSHDLMTKGRSGRVILLDPAGGKSSVVAGSLCYSFGVLGSGDDIWFSETWRHRVIKAGPSQKAAPVVIDELPGYPCRLSRASDGGAWLSVFAGRTQLIEFVLREPTYRKRMVAEVDPKYWIAPALSSGNTFLEPLQGAGVKMRGVLKPWAPPRSYGLVIKLSAAGHPEYSFHSRLGGRSHGVVAAAECDGFLYILSKGSGRILKLKVPPQGGN